MYPRGRELNLKCIFRMLEAVGILCLKYYCYWPVVIAVKGIVCNIK